ncbi:MAG: ECF-type sigma factor [Planctomycetota bacterium]
MDELPPDAEPAPGSDPTFEGVYEELRTLARAALRQQRVDHTLQPTALVNEVWLKLSRGRRDVNDRGHFLALAARAMRQVLQDHARAHVAQKRGQRAPGVQLEAGASAEAPQQFDVVALDDVLTRLAQLNERHARVAELRLLGGLTLPEVAQELEVSLRTVEGDWQMARAWLRSELAG